MAWEFIRTINNGDQHKMKMGYAINDDPSQPDFTKQSFLRSTSIHILCNSGQITVCIYENGASGMPDTVKWTDNSTPDADPNLGTATVLTLNAGDGASYFNSPGVTNEGNFQPWGDKDGTPPLGSGYVDVKHAGTGGPANYTLRQIGSNTI